MRMLLSNTEIYRVDTEEEAKALIEEIKEEADDYIVDSYSSTRKQKKKKGEIIAGYQVKITKKYSDFWVMEEAE